MAGLALHCARPAVRRRLRARPAWSARRDVGDRPFAARRGKIHRPRELHQDLERRELLARASVHGPIHARPHAHPHGARLRAGAAHRRQYAAPAPDEDHRVPAGRHRPLEFEPVVVLAVRRAGRPHQQAPHRSARHPRTDRLVRDRGPRFLGGRDFDHLESRRLRHGSVRLRNPVDQSRHSGGRGDGRRRLLEPGPSDDSAADPQNPASDDARQRDRVDAGFRPVLHHDLGRSERADLHRGVLDLPEFVRLLQAGLRGRALARADGNYSCLLDRANRADRAERTVMSALAPAAASRAIARPRAERTTAAAYLGPAACLGVIAIMGAPLVLSFLASIKTPEDASAVPPHYLPGALSLENYLKVIDYEAGLANYVGNSALVALITIAASIALAAPAGYGLARFTMRGKEIAFLILLAPIMIPYQAILTPLYLDFAKVGLVNTRVGLAIVHTILQLPFSIYLMRNSFEAIPREIEEAAMIDGCSAWRRLTYVFLPLAVPALVTVALFAFINSWNEFLAALIFMNRESSFTVPILLVSVRMGHHGAVDWGALQASIVISIIPCLAVYLTLQRYYVSGLLSGAVK